MVGYSLACGVIVCLMLLGGCPAGGDNKTPPAEDPPAGNSQPPPPPPSEDTPPDEKEPSFVWTMKGDTPDSSRSNLTIYQYTSGAALSTELGVPSLKIPSNTYALAEFNSAPNPPHNTPNPDFDFNIGTAEFEIYFDLQFYISEKGTGASDGTWAVSDGFGGSGAHGTFTTTDGSITAMTVTSPGSGYLSNGTQTPTVVATSGTFGTGVIGVQFPDCMWLRLGNENTDDAAFMIQGRGRNEIRVVRGNASNLNNDYIRDTLDSNVYSLTTGTWHRIVVKWRTSQSPYLYVNMDGGVPSTYSELLSGDKFTASDSEGDLLLTHTKDFKDRIPVRFVTTGILPGGLAADKEYWLVKHTATTSKIAESFGQAEKGIVVTFTSVGSGIHRLGTTIDAVTTQVLLGNDTQTARSYHLRNLRLWRTWRDEVM